MGNYIENNKLIAEFMGLIVVPSGTKSLGMINLPEYPEAFLKYERDWNELMPVVEKIERLGCAIHIDSTTVFLHFPERINKMKRFSFEDNDKTKLDCVYNAVIAFILWHNANPTHH